jgi:uncharacterized protein
MISEEQKQIIQKILQPFAPSRIGIFGSVARGEARVGSDLDILVNFTRKYSLFNLVEMQDALQDALNCKVDLVTEKSLHPAIKPYIEKDLILIKDGERA